ncbi:MAG TPA: hypothetical protein VE732_09255, partial [Nitrososphaera sp.]|nr:hypothetical protein [Nitrososphaera sp.]
MKIIYTLPLLLAFSINIWAQQPTEITQPTTRASGDETKKVCVVGEVVKPLEISFKDRLTLPQA